MKQHTTAARLKQIMDARGMKQADIIRAVDPFCKKYNVKLGKSILSQYLSGKTEPGQEKLTILGLALNVSEAWLMGYDVPMERNITPTTETSDGRKREFNELFDLLSTEKQDLILHAMKGLLAD